MVDSDKKQQSEQGQQEAPLDLATLNDMFRQNNDLIRDILSAFQDSFGNFAVEFKSAESAGNQQTMSRLAHTLKGSAGNIRADQLAVQAHDLQSRIEEGARDDDIHETVDDLLESLDELNAFIDDYLA